MASRIAGKIASPVSNAAIVRLLTLAVLASCSWLIPISALAARLNVGVMSMLYQYIPHTKNASTQI